MNNLSVIIWLFEVVQGCWWLFEVVRVVRAKMAKNAVKVLKIKEVVQVVRGSRVLVCYF